MAAIKQLMPTQAHHRQCVKVPPGSPPEGSIASWRLGPETGLVRADRQRPSCKEHCHSSASIAHRPPARRPLIDQGSSRGAKHNRGSHGPLRHPTLGTSPRPKPAEPGARNERDSRRIPGSAMGLPSRGATMLGLATARRRLLSLSGCVDAQHRSSGAADTASDCRGAEAKCV